MKKYPVRFEQDPALKDIEVVVRARQMDASVSGLIGRLASAMSEPLTVNDDAGNCLMLDEDQIVLASADGKRVNIISEDGRYFTRQTLQSLEETLDPGLFVRISRYEIINLSKVIRYDFSISGTLRIELAGGMEVWASRRCIPAIRRKLRGRVEGGGRHDR